MAKNVEPLKAKVRDMEKQQAKTTKLLADLNDQLGVLSKELGELDTNFKEKNEELTGLQTQAALMEKRLAAASKLITGLTGERTRWTSDIGDLNNSKVQLVGDCLLAASFLSYAGAFTSDFRAGMIYDTFAKKVRSRRPYAIDATRVHLTMPWVFSFWISRPFGPSRATAMLCA